MDISKLLKYLRYLNPARNCYWRIQGTRPVTIDGVSATFDTSSVGATAALLHSLDTEVDILRDYISELREDDVVYDVGANYGLYSCFAACGEVERVYAFEPLQQNVAWIAQNFEQNEISNGRILNVALSDKNGVAAFDPPTWKNQVTGTSSLVTAGHEHSVEVETVTVDRLVRTSEVAPPTVVKIDVEGAEGRVLNGMTSVLADDQCRCIYCEIHQGTSSIDEFGDSPREVIDLLERNGFSLTTLKQTERQIHVKARKSKLN